MSKDLLKKINGKFNKKLILVFGLILIAVLILTVRTKGHQMELQNQTEENSNSVVDILADKVVLREETYDVDDLSLKALFTSGIDCGSCHAQTLLVYIGDLNVLSVDGADIRAKVVDGNLLVKSQLSGGGVPSKGTMGIVKVYAVDKANQTLTEISEYQEEYTVEDYTGEAEN